MWKCFENAKHCSNARCSLPRIDSVIGEAFVKCVVHLFFFFSYFTVVEYT